MTFEGVRYTQEASILSAQPEGGGTVTSITASYVDTTGGRHVGRGPSYSWHEDSTFSARSYEGQSWFYSRHGSVIGFSSTLKDSSLLWEWFAQDGSLVGLQLFPKVRGIDWPTGTLVPAPKQFLEGQPLERREWNAWAAVFNRTWWAFDDSLSRLGTKPKKGSR